MKRAYIKFSVAASLIFTASALALLAGCSNPAGSSDADRPEAAEVKTVYDAVNDTANYLCCDDVNNCLYYKITATCYYRDTGDSDSSSYTMKVDINPTGATSYPFTVVYSFYGYNPKGTSSYTVTGSQTAVITSSGWTATGSLTGTDSDITSMTTDMSSDGTTITGTLVVNGYPYDYATAAYR